MMANDGESTWRFWAPLAVVIALIMFVVPLGIDFPLLDPDEGLHAGIAQEMVERGDWITPRFLGEPFLDKPILYFWAEAASLRLFGFGEAAVRLPGLMFGLLGALSTGLLAWRMFGASTGWIAGILYATTILPTALAQAASHDVALIPWINLALLLLWESEKVSEKGPNSSLKKGATAGLSSSAGRNTRENTAGQASSGTRTLGNQLFQRAVIPFSVCIIGAGFFVGLSILTKGLTGVAIVGIAYGGYRLISWRINPMLVLHGAVVLAVAALVAAPWYAALEIQNPGYLSYYFVDRHLLGVATSSQPHGDQPWWYYFPLLLGGGLPWIGYLPIILQDTWKRMYSKFSGRACSPFEPEYTAGKPARYTEQTTIPAPSPLLWCWLIGWMVFLTVARSKLATYLWPAFPPVAILAAVAWSRLIAGTLSEAARRSFARTFVWSSWSGPLVLPAAVFVVQILFDVRFPWPVWVVTAMAAAVAPLPLIPWRAGRWRASLTAAALSLAAQFTVVMTLILPQVAEGFSARDLAEHFNSMDKLPTRLFVVEERIGSVVFYLDPTLRAGLTTDKLSRLSLDRPPQLEPGDAVVVPRRNIEKSVEVLDLGDSPYESVGRYRLYRIIKPRPVVAPK